MANLPAHMLQHDWVKRLINLGFLSADGGVLLSLADSAVKYAEASLTNAQLLAIRATPITLVAAPGVGKVLELVGGCLINDYTGAYTEGAVNLAVRYTGAAGAVASEAIEMTGFADAVADTVIKIIPIKDVLMVANAALVLHNTGGAEFGAGNAGNVWRVKLVYRIHSTTA